MASSTRTELALCFCLSVLTSGSALAQSPDSDARAAVLEGRKAFEAGDFETAIKQYEEAQRLKPAPGLLFNLAQSHRHAGHPERAIFYFRAYLETSPSEEQVRAVTIALVPLEAEHHLTLDPRRGELENERLLAAQRTRALTCVDLAAPPVTSRWWFWTIVGAAAVGTAVAVSVAASPHAARTTLAEINGR